MSSGADRAKYYVVRDAWIEKNISGETNVVIEVQGVRQDGSYWVTGFQIVMPKDEWDKMDLNQIAALIKQRVLDNEKALDDSERAVQESLALTEQFVKDPKYTQIRKIKINLIRGEKLDGEISLIEEEIISGETELK